MHQLEWRCSVCKNEGCVEIHNINDCNLSMGMAVYNDHELRSDGKCFDYKSIKIMFSYGHKSQTT